MKLNEPFLSFFSSIFGAGKSLIHMREKKLMNQSEKEMWKTQGLNYQPSGPP